MGTIICQNCEDIIEHFDSEKSAVLYGLCPTCHFENKLEE